MEFDHYNISNKRAHLDIGSVAIAQQLRSASQGFFSTSKHPCKRIPIETLEGTNRSGKDQVIPNPFPSRSTIRYIEQHCFGTSKAN